MTTHRRALLAFTAPLAVALAPCSSDDLRLAVLPNGVEATGAPIALTIPHMGDVFLGKKRLFSAEPESTGFEELERLVSALETIAADMESAEADVGGRPMVLPNEPLRIRADAFAPARSLLEVLLASGSTRVKLWRFELVGAAESEGALFRSGVGPEDERIHHYELPRDIGVNPFGEMPELHEAPINVWVREPGRELDASTGEERTPTSARPFVHSSDRALGYSLGANEFDDFATFADQVAKLESFAPQVHITLELESHVTCGEALRVLDLLGEVGIERVGILAPD